MLQLSSMLINRPVLSLRIGQPVAMTIAAIFNPDNLKIEGFYCGETRSRKTEILLCQDIRDILPQGFVVNDEENLSDPSELVRLERLLKINFELIGKSVETTSKQKIGKVSDYAVDIQSMYVQKLYVTRSLLKSFNSGTLGIDRTQIVEITDHRIIINDLDAKIPAGASVAA